MKNFNIELFNLAINFDNDDRCYPEDILTSMGETILRAKTVTGKSGNIARIEYLLLSGNIVSVKRLKGNKYKATIRPAFPVKPTVEKVENIFGKRWVDPNGGNLQVGDKVKLFDGRCNNVEAIDGGSFLIPSSDKWISKRAIQYVWK